MRRFIEWVRGWAITLDIRINDPELYKALTRPHVPSDFYEVRRPE